MLLHDHNHSYAGFGQASFRITDALILTGGVRVTRDSKRTTLLKTANTITDVSTFAGARDVTLADTQPSFDASLLYRVDPNFSLYARVARGFRGPTIQAARRCSTRPSQPRTRKGTPATKPG